MAGLNQQDNLIIEFTELLGVLLKIGKFRYERTHNKLVLVCLLGKTGTACVSFVGLAGP